MAFMIMGLLGRLDNDSNKRIIYFVIQPFNCRCWTGLRVISDLLV